MEQEDTQPHLICSPFRFRQRGIMLMLEHLPRYDGQSAHVFDETELRALYKILEGLLANLPEEREQVHEHDLPHDR